MAQGKRGGGASVVSKTVEEAGTETNRRRAEKEKLGTRSHPRGIRGSGGGDWEEG